MPYTGIEYINCILYTFITYIASNGTTAPFYSCDAFNDTNGIWSNVTYDCTGIRIYLITVYSTFINESNNFDVDTAWGIYICSMLTAAIASYCASPSVNIPTLLNTDGTPTPVQTMGGLTYYTCANGTQSSSGSATLPYYQCAPYMSSAGKWSLNSWSCEGTVQHCLSTNIQTLWEYVNVILY